MSFEQYPNELKIVVLEDNDKLYMGKYAFTENVELQYIVATLHKRGNGVGNEKFRLNIYSENDTARTIPVYQSEFFEYSDLPAFEYFLGSVRFDFCGEFLASGKTYQLEIEAQNYTRTADTYYFSYVLDHPAIINERDVAGETGAQVAFWGRRF